MKAIAFCLALVAGTAAADFSIQVTPMGGPLPASAVFVGRAQLTGTQLDALGRPLPVAGADLSSSTSWSWPLVLAFPPHDTQQTYTGFLGTVGMRGLVKWEQWQDGMFFSGFPNPEVVPPNRVYTVTFDNATGMLSGKIGPDQTPPTAPAALVAVASGMAAVNLTWKAATDDSGAVTYLVERCIGQTTCGPFTQIGATAQLSYADTAGLTATTVYSYRVRAGDAAGNLGAYSNVATAVTADAPSPAPTLTVSAQGDCVAAATNTGFGCNKLVPQLVDAGKVVWTFVGGKILKAGVETPNRFLSSVSAIYFWNGKVRSLGGGVYYCWNGAWTGSGC